MATGKTEETVDNAGQKNLSRPSNLCCYSQRVCNLEKLKGFDFCHKHILEDKASPFKPCDFYAKSNERRCMNPAPKLHDKEKSYCIIHTRKSELRRAVEKRRKKRRRDSTTVEEDEEESTTEKRKRTTSTASQKSVDGSQKDEELHSSDDDLGMELGIAGSLKVDSAWHGDVDSDAESVDSEEEDALRHAGVWTLDEASKTCYEKMIRLKSLYVAQYKRLFHVLKEKRRKYLQVIQAEQENESVESHLSPSEVLRSPSHHKRHGVEAILHKQAKEKRHGGSTRHQNTSHQRCTHVADGVRCPNRILPLTKYCIHHISHDPNQLLFQSCSFKTGDQKTCNNMVPKIYPFSTCQLHITLPAEANRTDVKKDLDEAKKRDEEKKASENERRIKAVGSVIINTIPPLHQVTDKQLPIPKALQQKSSALIPPLAQVTKETTSSQETPPTIKVSSAAPLPTKPSTLKVEKMVVDSLGLEGPLVRSRASSGSTPMEVLSPASVDSPAGVQNISPTLLAASLAAVCSDAPIATVTSPVATTSSSSYPTISTPSSDSKTPPVNTVSAPAASRTTTSSTSTISTSSASNDPSTLITSAPTGLMSVTPNESDTPKDPIIPSSSPAIPTKKDLQDSSNAGDDCESQKPLMTASDSSVSGSQGSTTVSHTSEATDNTSITLSISESQASSMKTDSLETDSTNTDTLNTDSMETDSMEKAATSSVTSTAESSFSVADQNPTTTAPATTSVSTPSSDCVPESLPETTPKDTQGGVTLESDKPSSDN